MLRIGEYELVKELGEGGMGTVWLGVRTFAAGMQKKVAIKVMSEKFAPHPRAKELFLREVKIGSALSHGNIVQVFDQGEHDGRLYLVMEYVDGMNLAQLMRVLRRKDLWLPQRVVAFIVREVLRALRVAQEVTNEDDTLDVVHRDVSPQNILLSLHGEVKLTDFGVARLAGETTATAGRSVGAGKLQYMAPEQFRSDAASREYAKKATVDLYAVGAILHELLCKERLRPGDEDAELTALAVGGDVPELPNRADVAPELDLLRKRLLEPDPKKRIGSAKEALESLAGWTNYDAANEELRDLMKRATGLRAARSGLHEAASKPETTPSGAPTNVPEGRDEPSSGPEGEASLHTAQDLPFAAPALPTRARPPARSNRPIILAGVGAICVAGIGIAMFASSQMGQVSRDEPEPRVAAVPVAAPMQEEQAPVEETAVEQPEPERDPAREAEREAKGERMLAEALGEPEKSAEPEPVATPTPKAEKPKGKATVEFKTGEFRFVWIKVKGKVLPLEPIQTAELPAGKHRVWFRESKEDGWKSAGWIKLEPGKRYVGRMQKPGKIKLTRE